MREAIAEALWHHVKAPRLADECDDLQLPQRDDLPDPMASKRVYVKARLRGLGIDQLIEVGRQVHHEFPHSDLERLLNPGAARSVDGEVKNIIFAAVGAKPTIVIRDALSNLLEITDGSDRVLVYDREVGEAGLTWSSLTSWWVERQVLRSSGDTDGARQLYGRLVGSVANEAERMIFRAYCGLYGTHGGDIPAMLPQVYLHYDPYARGRGGTLVRQRMDFLLLLPHGRRVVIELDGVQHYADHERASCGHYAARPAKYAEMVKEDRTLQLHGYEVYRFGGAELVNREEAQAMLGDFFRALLDLPSQG
ncbi:hypothetical protein [Myceligenerans pegani]|uniref:AbiJ-NTD3 domain-containing protein n=1 Tax=Myceligenerans pegani TaxID=2776917 RepID=A0ABR9MSY5_9MICO|nr:hypothetical protein [Myceligenerans sp. TRM 65318]MBE1874486.1 hypothetical protein [Myceligenerans sp. TRM 65318]MBE3016757.1 hypothetical protein [Myceligenerans sp. TRM 65318]